MKAIIVKFFPVKLFYLINIMRRRGNWRTNCAKSLEMSKLDLMKLNNLDLPKRPVSIKFQKTAPVPGSSTTKTPVSKLSDDYSIKQERSLTPKNTEFFRKCVISQKPSLLLTNKLTYDDVKNITPPKFKHITCKYPSGNPSGTFGTGFNEYLDSLKEGYLGPQIFDIKY